jgi:hypothetical protein
MLRTGIVHLKFDSLVLNTIGEFTINLGRLKRTAIIASGEVCGAKEELAEPPSIKGSILIPEKGDLEKLFNSMDGTVTLRLGDHYFVLRSAWLAEHEIATDDGKVNVTFQGKSMEMLG